MLSFLRISGSKHLVSLGPVACHLKNDIISPGFSPMIFSLENPTKPRIKRYPADMQSNPDGQFRRHTAAHETRAYFTPRVDHSLPVSTVVGESRGE